MGSEYTFYDYVGGGGTNAIRVWLDGLPVKARAKFKRRLLALEGTRPGDWTRPLVDTLSGHCRGLFAVRVRDDKQHRILGAHMDRTPILLHGFDKPGKKVDTQECDRAFSRLADVNGDPQKYRVEHNYDD